MASNPLLRKTMPLPHQCVVFDSDLPRFGNSVFFTVNGCYPNIRFNNMIKMIYSPAYWAITIWFLNKTNGEEFELEWMINQPFKYNDNTSIISHVLGAFIEHFTDGLDQNDLSGKTWTAEALVRRLSNKEVEELISCGITFETDFNPLEKYDLELFELDDNEKTHLFNPEKPTYWEAETVKKFKRA